MLVNPCASVSWISRASRSRSADTPAARDSRWVSARLAFSSLTTASSLARCRIEVTITVPTTSDATMPSSVLATETGISGDRGPSTITSTANGATLTAAATTSAGPSGNTEKMTG